MKSIEREKHVARDDEFRVAVATRCVRSERVVTRQVRVNNFDLVLPYEACQVVRAADVERVAQRQHFDVGRRHAHVLDHGRLRPHDEVEIVPAFDQRVAQIGNVSFAAAK
jgi:hypothetical protein